MDGNEVEGGPLDISGFLKQILLTKPKQDRELAEGRGELRSKKAESWMVRPSVVAVFSLLHFFWAIAQFEPSWKTKLFYFNYIRNLEEPPLKLLHQLLGNKREKLKTAPWEHSLHKG